MFFWKMNSYPWKKQFIDEVQGGLTGEDDYQILWIYDPVGYSGKTEMCALECQNTQLKTTAMLSKQIGRYLTYLDLPRLYEITSKDYIEMENYLDGRYDGHSGKYERSKLVVFSSSLPHQKSFYPKCIRVFSINGEKALQPVNFFDRTYDPL